MTARLPAVFFGHGSPMNALGGNRYTDAWRDFGAQYRPRAILVISAHWYAAGTRVTAAERPRTNHDFVSFKGPVSTFEYPAPGEVALACLVRDLLAPIPVALDERWGYDHGAWNVLANAYPKADVPVVELSLDRTQPPQFHYDLAARLAPLRDDGVLIVGSGNVIHNIEIMRTTWSDEPAGWERRFNDDLRSRLERGDHAGLVAYEKLGPDAQLAIPTPDHYLPFLSVLGLQRSDERPDILIDGDHTDGLGMLSVAMR
ncbi:MAG TPA: 4,5-DOPA dioxygenase extradiol [Candidatus Lustribacter sp.]